MLRPSQVSAAACAWHRARTSSCVPATVQAPAVLQAPNTQPTYPLITRVYPKAHDQKVEFHASFKSQETTGDRVCLSRYSARPGSRLRRMRFCHPGRQRPVRRLQKRSDHLDFIGRARAPQAAGTPRRHWASPSMHKTFQKTVRACFPLFSNFSLGCCCRLSSLPGNRAFHPPGKNDNGPLKNCWTFPQSCGSATAFAITQQPERFRSSFQHSAFPTPPPSSREHSGWSHLGLPRH